MYNVAIVGKFGSGKSTLADTLVRQQGYTRVANAGALKEFATMAYGEIDKSAEYEITKDYGLTAHEVVSGREVLQGLGQIVKEFDRDFWLKAMTRDMQTKAGPFVCDDTRFPFEAEYLHEHGWIIAKLYVNKDVRMERYEAMYGRLPTESEMNHPSETEVDLIEEDLALSGTETTSDLMEQLLDHMAWRESYDNGDFQ